MAISLTNIPKVECSLFNIYLFLKHKHVLCTKCTYVKESAMKSDLLPSLKDIQFSSRVTV